MIFNVTTKASPGDRVMVANYRRNGAVEEGSILCVEISAVHNEQAVDKPYHHIVYKIKLLRETPPTKWRPWPRPLRLYVGEDAIKEVLST